MGKIYVGQTKLRLTVDTKVNLTTSTSVTIKCIKPDGTTDSFSATVDSTTEGDIYYDFVAGDLDQGGIWTLWAFVTFNNGFAPGEPFTIRVYTEGA